MAKTILYITHNPLQPSHGPTLHTVCVCAELTALGYDITLSAPVKQGFDFSRLTQHFTYKKSRVPFWRSIGCEAYAMKHYRQYLTKIDYLYIRLANFHVLPFIAHKPIFLEINGDVEKEYTLAKRPWKGKFIHQWHQVLYKK